MGRLLHVDLSSSKVTDMKLDAELAKSFIGGRGIGIKLLYDLAPSGIEPLSPENPLIMMTGPCTGTLAPFSAFYSVTTKSPLTGTCCSSHAGGHFGAELKFSGVDGIIFTGKSSRPCYLHISDGAAELVHEMNIWGLDAHQTHDFLEEKHPGVKIACVGQGGENLVSFASIVSDRDRMAARGGVGAVMASKMLKAVAVRGDRLVKVSDGKGLAEISNRVMPLAKEKGKGLHKYGTPQVTAITNEAGVLPTRNFQRGNFEGAESIEAEALVEKHKFRDKGCFACQIGCSKINRAGEFALEGPEYETIFSLGSNCGNEDLGKIIEANLLCNRYGIDTITTGNVLAFSFELYERGIISREDTGGLELTWGNGDAMVELIHRIARREGFGAILAEGVKRAAEKIGRGAENYAVHVKGLEPAGYDPRGVKGMALAYGTSSRGACHLRAQTYTVELFQGAMDPLTLVGKAQLTKDLQDVAAVLDSMTMCKFGSRYSFGNSLDSLAEVLRTVTGFEINGAELKKIGEQTYNLERMFNLRNGFSKVDDMLPNRFFEKLPYGEEKFHVLAKEDYINALEEYYALRGWSSDGKPTLEKAKELGLFKEYQAMTNAT